MLRDLKLSPSFSQRMISRGRVFDSKGKAYKNGDSISENNIYIAQFEGHTRGLKPLITFEHFALFDKPSNLVIHPNSKKTAYSLLDEIRYHFGESANQVHRIDAETSGLVLVGLHEEAINDLSTMFENKHYKKSYLAIVEGELKEALTIDKALTKEGKSIGVRMKTCQKDEGKESITKVWPLQYNAKRNTTLVECEPVTGRQHQLRVHLYSIGHRIIGDPIYGVDDETAESYLNKTLSAEERYKTSGGSRLWLQANYLEFEYKNRLYKISSKNQDILKEFNQD